MKRSFFAAMPLVVVGTILATQGEVFAQQQTEGRLPVPDAAVQAEALELIRDVYREEWDRAQKAEEKTALANKLLAQAVKSLDDPAGRFVLLRLARDVAAQAGDAETALAAVDRIGNTYEVDVLQMRVECLQAVAKAASGSSQIKALARQAIALVDAAVAEDDYELAKYFGELANASARRARDFLLVKQIVARMKEVDGQAKVFAQYKEALATLEKKPTDPQANLTAGRYLCLLRGDWDQGVPMLALGSDEALKAAASKELGGATSATAQVGLGDGWWDLAEQTDGEAKRALLERAAHWYRQAAPKLTQLLKLRVEKRIQSIEQAIDDGPAKDEKTSGRTRRTRSGSGEVDLRVFQGRWVIKYSNGTFRRYVIDANGGVTCLGHGDQNVQGKLTQSGNEILLDLGDNKLERLQVMDGTLRVQHFSPASSYPYSVTEVGIGIKMP